MFEDGKTCTAKVQNAPDEALIAIEFAITRTSYMPGTDPFEVFKAATIVDFRLGLVAFGSNCRMALLSKPSDAALLISVALMPFVYSTPVKDLPAFLDTHCASCHNPEKRKGKLDLSPVIADLSGTSSEKLITLLDVLEAGDMPPEDEPQPSDQERAAAIHVLSKMLLSSAEKPGHGNLLDHQTLFTEPQVRRAATPARLWRMSPYIFRNYANDMTKSAFLNRNGGRDGDDDLHPAFAYMTPEHAFRDHAEAHVFEEATSEILFDVCWQLAGLQYSGKGRKEGPLKSFQAIKKTGRVTRELWTNLIQTQFEIALRRVATKEELAETIALGEKMLKETDKVTATRSVLTAIMLRPDAVYRFEIGQGRPDKFGRSRLADLELAHSLAFALTDDAPDPAMLASVEAGELNTREGISRQVTRLLESPTSHERIIRFFEEYFEYPRVTEVFKDKSHPNYYRPETRIADANNLIAYILKGDQQVIRRLLTEDKVFAASGATTKTPFFANMMKKYYLADFGLPADFDWKSAEQPVLPTTGRRSGILTHPAWLLSFSDNEKNQAIQRGRWVHMKLLGGNIPDTPIGVDAVLPEFDGVSTLRDRMHVTRAKYCWRCHERMDPLGLTFEQFDDFGRWRENELGKPIDATGKIEIGDPALDGPAKDVFEMLERLSKSERVEQVFTRYVFRYFLGRNETYADAPTLIDAHKAYRDSGGSFKALVSSIINSDSFLLRTQ